MVKSSKETSFHDLERVHELIADWFGRHQEAVVLGDVGAAGLHLDRTFEILSTHMRVEDEILIPAFAELGEAPPGCSPELLSTEHRKLKRLFGDIRRQLRRHEQSGCMTPKDRIALLDRERMLKEVLAHHDQRERTAFFPALNKGVRGRKRREMLARCWRIQGELPGDGWDL